MNRLLRAVLMLAFSLCVTAAGAQEASIRVHADKITHEVTRYMTGACLEDVNHEIYGGIYSQMVFGESFQEPSPPRPIKGCRAFGGTWTVVGGELHAAAGQGPRLVSDHAPLGTGEVAVQIQFGENLSGHVGAAGLIVKVREPGLGPDRFVGYEVSLDPNRQIVSLSRHRNNWEPLKEAPCKVPVGQWIALAVVMTETSLEVRVDGQPVLTFEDRVHPLPGGAVGLRTWRKAARFRGLSVKSGAKTDELAFRHEAPLWDDGISGMWQAVRRGEAKGSFAGETDKPFHGARSQRITFTEGPGEIGIENRGLNRWGMHFVAGKPYEGYLWLRADQPTEAFVSLESGDGKRTYAQARIAVAGADWKRYDFTLTPSGDDSAGRLAVTLKRPGSIVLGHAFLQPGEWGRFKGQPVRRDVAEGLIAQGVTVLRLGGLMANAAEYRWKKMLGPRDRRPPYKGYWYPYSTNGWGIIEFLNFCEAAGFLAIPDFNMDETPSDMADFVDYVNGPPESAWGRRRVQDGHVRPYGLKYLQLGNEETVDEAYWRKFKPLAEAIWAKDPGVVLIVGDFEYKKPIIDPYKVEGASRITTLAAHKKILDLAKAHGREVWFDVHIWNHNPREAEVRIAVLSTFADALAKLSPGADFKLCVLEENAINHAVRRAIAHAETINGLMRLGDRVKVVCAANCLQPYRENDNGWDQGLLFLTSSKVWGQPPYYVTQMMSRNYRPACLKVAIESPGAALDAVALTGDGGHGRGLTLQVVNRADQRVRTRIQGLPKGLTSARVTQLSGQLDEVNTPEDPARVVPWERDWNFKLDVGDAYYTFPPRSVTVMNFKE